MYITNGLAGGEVIADTEQHDMTTTAWGCLKALGGDVVFAAVAGNISGLASTTLSNGDFIVGHFTSITLTSGTLIAYYERSPAS